MNEIIVTTSRLILRYPVKEDIEFMVQLWMDPDMTKYTGGHRERTFLENEFNNATLPEKREEYDLWVLEERESKRLIGSAGFIPKEIDGKIYVELNYYIEKKYWGMGYAKEISAGLIHYGFTIKDQNEIISIIAKNNSVSMKVAESVGMKKWKQEKRSGELKYIYKIKRN